LPAIKPASGLRIPQGSSNLLQANYRLKTNLVIVHIILLSILVNFFYVLFLKNTGKKVMKKSTKITAAEMLNATKQTEAISNAKTTTQCN